jgi:hypothetical protein
VETCFIEVNREKLTVEQLSEKLDRTPATIKKYIKNVNEKIDKKNKEEFAKAEAESAANHQAEQEVQQANDGTPIITFENMMAKKRESVIMTPAASQLADEIRRNRSKNKKQDTSCLFKIKKDK